MTRVSCSAQGPAQRFRYDRLLAYGIIGWHAGCIVLGQMACFVTWEIPLVDENEAPLVLNGGFDDGELVTIDDDQTFWVAAQDPDSQEPLVFLWKAGANPLFGEQSQVGEGGDPEGPIFQSLVVVPYDPDLNGDTVECQVYDGDGGKVELVWPVEVL